MMTYPNQFILGTSGEILAVRAEANAANVKVACDIDAVVLENT